MGTKTRKISALLHNLKNLKKFLVLGIIVCNRGAEYALSNLTNIDSRYGRCVLLIRCVPLNYAHLFVCPGSRRAVTETQQGGSDSGHSTTHQLLQLEESGICQIQIRSVSVFTTPACLYALNIIATTYI